MKRNDEEERQQMQAIEEGKRTRINQEAIDKNKAFDTRLSLDAD